MQEIEALNDLDRSLICLNQSHQSHTFNLCSSTDIGLTVCVFSGAAGEEVQRDLVTYCFGGSKGVVMVDIWSLTETEKKKSFLTSRPQHFKHSGKKD